MSILASIPRVRERGTEPRSPSPAGAPHLEQAKKERERKRKENGRRREISREGDWKRVGRSHVVGPAKLRMTVNLCWQPKLALPKADRFDRSGRPVRPVWSCAVRVELGFELWNPFVTQFGRGTSSPAYKYKGHGRLMSFYPIESINLQFSYFPQTLAFPTSCCSLLVSTAFKGVMGGLPASRQP